jgi:hypothetical protein
MRSMSCDEAVATAEELAGLDGDLQASRDPAQRARLANELRCTAAACEVAETRAIRAVFVLRLQELALEDAHALMLRGQLEDVEWARMLARVGA